MTWNALARQAANQLLPNTALNSLKRLKKAISPLDMTAPVLQMYINDGNISTHICINNFYSFLAAAVETRAKLEIIFYNATGKEILRLNELLGQFQSRFIDVTETLEQHSIESSLGVVTVQLIPIHPRKAIYKRFGPSSSHFFQFFRDPRGSVSMIHPSTLAAPASKATGSWLSNQVIETHNLKKVVLYQCNPSSTPHAMSHSLREASSGAIVATHQTTLPSMATNSIDFDLHSIAEAPQRLILSIDSLPSDNSKPMLCRVFKDERFSMNHS